MDFILDKLSTGALKNGGSWGGPTCRSYVDMETHLKEDLAWLVYFATTYFTFGVAATFGKVKSQTQKALEGAKASIVETCIDKTFACIHFIMYGMLINWKNTDHSMAFLLTPCHVILLLQGIALASDGPLANYITLFILPSLIGTTLAIFFPDTSGLDKWLEAESYWVQHYLIVLMPIYLLSRKNFMALKMANNKTIIVGLWILGLLHFTLYEVWDLLLNVNVEFMLCPSAAMEGAFNALPQKIFWPTYRTTMCIVVFILGFLISWMYILCAKAVQVMVGAKVKSA